MFLVDEHVGLTVPSLLVGDLALFMRDEYKNYLAVSVDGKIYYLNNSCVPHFSQDLSEKGIAIP